MKRSEQNYPKTRAEILLRRCRRLGAWQRWVATLEDIFFPLRKLAGWIEAKWSGLIEKWSGASKVAPFFRSFGIVLALALFCLVFLKPWQHFSGIARSLPLVSKRSEEAARDRGENKEKPKTKNGGSNSFFSAFSPKKIPDDLRTALQVTNINYVHNEDTWKEPDSRSEYTRYVDELIGDGHWETTEIVTRGDVVTEVYGVTIRALVENSSETAITARIHVSGKTRKVENRALLGSIEYGGEVINDREILTIEPGGNVFEKYYDTSSEVQAGGLSALFQAFPNADDRVGTRLDGKPTVTIDPYFEDTDAWHLANGKDTVESYTSYLKRKGRKNYEANALQRRAEIRYDTALRSLLNESDASNLKNFIKVAKQEEKYLSAERVGNIAQAQKLQGAISEGPKEILRLIAIWIGEKRSARLDAPEDEDKTFASLGANYLPHGNLEKIAEGRSLGIAFDTTLLEKSDQPANWQELVRAVAMRSDSAKSAEAKQVESVAAEKPQTVKEYEQQHPAPIKVAMQSPKLQRGEFEKSAEFRQRKEIALAQFNAEKEKREAEYQKAVEAHQTKVTAYRGSLPGRQQKWEQRMDEAKQALEQTQFAGGSQYLPDILPQFLASRGQFMATPLQYDADSEIYTAHIQHDKYGDPLSYQVDIPMAVETARNWKKSGTSPVVYCNIDFLVSPSGKDFVLANPVFHLAIDGKSFQAIPRGGGSRFLNPGALDSEIKNQGEKGISFVTRVAENSSQEYFYDILEEATPDTLSILASSDCQAGESSRNFFSAESFATQFTAQHLLRIAEGYPRDSIVALPKQSEFTIIESAAFPGELGQAARKLIQTNLNSDRWNENLKAKQLRNISKLDMPVALQIAEVLPANSFSALASLENAIGAKVREKLHQLIQGGTVGWIRDEGKTWYNSGVLSVDSSLFEKYLTHTPLPLLQELATQSDSEGAKARTEIQSNRLEEIPWAESDRTWIDEIAKLDQPLVEASCPHIPDSWFAEMTLNKSELGTAVRSFLGDHLDGNHPWITKQDVAWFQELKTLDESVSNGLVSHGSPEIIPDLSLLNSGLGVAGRTWLQDGLKSSPVPTTSVLDRQWFLQMPEQDAELVKLAVSKMPYEVIVVWAQLSNPLGEICRNNLKMRLTEEPELLRWVSKDWLTEIHSKDLELYQQTVPTVPPSVRPF